MASPVPHVEAFAQRLCCIQERIQQRLGLATRQPAQGIAVCMGLATVSKCECLQLAYHVLQYDREPPLASRLQTSPCQRISFPLTSGSTAKGPEIGASFSFAAVQAVSIRRMFIDPQQVLPCHDESCSYCFPKHPKVSKLPMELAKEVVMVRSLA